MRPPIVVNTESEARSVVAILNEESQLGIDCEGLNLGLKGEVTLIQIAKEYPETVYLFDILECPGIIHILQPILEDETILKIIHDCRSDRTNLLKDFNIRLEPVFDTQIAYKYIYPETAEYRMGWNKMCKFYNAPVNKLKDKFHNIYRTNPAIWKVRPLTKDMIKYASADVGNLHFFYKRMNKKLTGISKKRMNRFKRECEEAILKPGQDSTARF